MSYPRTEDEPTRHSPARPAFGPPAKQWPNLRTDIAAAFQPYVFRPKFPYSMVVAAKHGEDAMAVHDGLPEAALRSVGALLMDGAALETTAQTTRIVNRGGLSGWQCKKVAEAIEERLSEPLPLAELARLVNLSPYHFARAFKRSFGVPPHRYHVMRRIERAKIMLAEPMFTITDIAVALGFAETSSFSAAFRKATGQSPSEYRRLLQGARQSEAQTHAADV